MQAFSSKKKTARLVWCGLAPLILHSTANAQQRLGLTAAATCERGRPRLSAGVTPVKTKRTGINSKTINQSRTAPFLCLLATQNVCVPAKKITSSSRTIVVASFSHCLPLTPPQRSPLYTTGILSNVPGSLLAHCLACVSPIHGAQVLILRHDRRFFLVHILSVSQPTFLNPFAR